jgi:hypothetical protein
MKSTNEKKDEKEEERIQVKIDFRNSCKWGAISTNKLQERR